MPTESEKLLFRFVSHRAALEHEYVFICGSIPEMGNWNADLALPMFECGSTTYHVKVMLPIDKNIEYKYLLKVPNCTPVWDEGDNRVVNMSKVITGKPQHMIEIIDEGGETDGTGVVRIDPWLRPNIPGLRHRYGMFKQILFKIKESGYTLDTLSMGYTHYGFNRATHPTLGSGIWYREWAPGADALSLVGQFNDWNENTHIAKKDPFGTFELFIPDVEGRSAIPHESLIKVCLTKNGGKFYRIPAWINRAIQEFDPSTNKPKNVFTGQYWCPNKQYEWKNPNMPPLDREKDHGLRIYESHVGMASAQPKVASFSEFKDVLRRIKDLGYNTVQLMAIMEHAYYGSFGYHVTNFFAVSSRFGTPDEFKELVDTAHGMGIRVIIDLVHSHACKNTEDGLNMFDGTDYQYFHSGPKGEHSGWDSRLFDYGKFEVQRFLLSNVRYYVEEFHVDGFRFDGVTSMLYKHHGLSKGFTGCYDDYFNDDVDLDAVTYLMLVNYLIHTFYDHVITIAEDVSGMATLCRPIKDGGIGFDYRLAMAMPDLWIKLLKEYKDDDWSMEEITHTLLNRRYGEKTVAYCESHDQALVGDKTVAFWLMDKEMYDFMAKSSPDTPIISRGLALHKMIRTVTYGLGGECYLNFMGNEFGHPEWIDFPRVGNNNSYHYCRRQWNLVDDKNLRYHFLGDWDKALHQLEKDFGFLIADDTFVSLKHNNDKVIVFEKAGLIWVFNFHTTNSYTDYKVGTSRPGKYVVALDSDDSQYGGYNRIDHNSQFTSRFDPWNGRPCAMFLYIPCRTVVIYKYHTLQ